MKIKRLGYKLKDTYSRLKEASAGIFLPLVLHLKVVAKSFWGRIKYTVANKEVYLFRLLFFIVVKQCSLLYPSKPQVVV